MTNPFRHKPQNNYYTDFKEIIGMKRNLEQFTGKTLKFVSMTHKIRIIILWTFFCLPYQQQSQFFKSHHKKVQVFDTFFSIK